MSKTVTIDARWLVGGIGTYTRNLLQEFHHYSNGFSIQAIVRQRDSTCVRSICEAVTIVDLPIYTLLEQLLIPRASRHCDLLHIPHFNAPLLHRGPLIVSIMDLIHLKSPAYRRKWSTFVYAWPMLHAVARKADHIVTVSDFSKNQIIETLRVPESKVTVIPCGVGKEFTAGLSRTECRRLTSSLGIPFPFILYVGNLKPHKNVKTLLLAFAQMRKGRKMPHSLVLVANDERWKPAIVQECLKLGIAEAIVFAPQVSQSWLPFVYGAADLLVMPSMIEGFGLPVVEAMACGTPVVASSAASLPEVGGEAVLYFDPHSVEELAAQMERLLQSEELQASLSNSGIRRAKQFSWEKAARRHIELYGQFLGHN